MQSQFRSDLHPGIAGAADRGRTTITSKLVCRPAGAPLNACLGERQSGDRLLANALQDALPAREWRE